MFLLCPFSQKVRITILFVFRSCIWSDFVFVLCECALQRRACCNSNNKLNPIIDRLGSVELRYLIDSKFCLSKKISKNMKQKLQLSINWGRTRNCKWRRTLDEWRVQRMLWRFYTMSIRHSFQFFIYTVYIFFSRTYTHV